MKKILIVSYLFAPYNTIGAIRPTKIAKYLTVQGVSVDVITGSLKNNIDEKLKDDIKNMNKVITIKHGSTIQKINNKVTSTVNKKQNFLLNGSADNKVHRKSRIKNKLSWFYRTSLYLLSCFDFYKQTKKYIKRRGLNLEEYDAVFTTFGPLSNLWIGLYIKKKYKKIKWVADFRDPILVDLTPLVYKPYYRHMEKKVCKKADEIICVSKGYLDRICRGKYSLKSSTITNGYDVDDLPKNINMRASDKFRFTYVGAMYEGKRLITPLFEVLAELIKEKSIEKENVEFVYAGRDFKFLFDQAAKYKIEDILIDKGQLPRKECIELQYGSRYLVLSTWNNKGEEGVFPGKFLEYMLFNKPIVAIVSGDVPNSEVCSVINKANLGVCYEEVCKSEHYEILKNYILSEYLRYENHGNSFFKPDKDILDYYNYKNISRLIYNKIYDGEKDEQ